MRKLTLVNNQGQALLELILAISIASFFLTTFVVGIISVREAFNHSSISAEAKLLLQKEVEALRSIKETSWNSFSLPGTYHVTTEAGNVWGVAPGTVVDNKLTHSFNVADVCRMQANSLPVPCSTLLSLPDPATKKITATVSWSFLGNESISASLYLTRNFNNVAATQTTQTEFNNGTRVNTSVTNTAGGEVQLAPYSGASWNNPQVVSSRKIGGTVGANDVFVANNKAYIVTDSQTGADFFIYDVTDPTNPSALGNYDLAANGYKVVVSGNYAYIASANNSQELTILNVSNPATPTLTGAFNAPSSADGRGVFVVGTTAFLVTENNTTNPGYEFYAINISNPQLPIQRGGLNLGAAARDVQVVGNYSYVASTSNNQELQIVNVTNPNSPALAGSYNTQGGSDANSVFVLNNTAYTVDSQLNILNITNPANVSFFGNYNSPGTPFGVFVETNFAFIAHSQNNSEFKVINITNPNTPSLYGSASLGGQGNGIFVVGDYAYLATSNSNAQFQIVRGGSGGVYQSSGNFESSTITASQPAAFNYFNFTIVKPLNTNLRFQIATDNAVWTYVGPDGTDASYFDTPTAINLAQISSQYFRYKAYFTGNGLVTPVLYDATVNYSP